MSDTTESAPAETQPSSSSRFFRFLKEAAIVLVGALIISVVLRTFVVAAFYIPSGSMEDTLKKDDRILALKFVPKVQPLRRGDVVVFADREGWLAGTVDPRSSDNETLGEAILKWIGFLPEDSNQYLVKRVIGLGGDRVECRKPDGPVYVNGVAIDESSYLYPGNNPCDGPNGPTVFDVTVPKDRMWVMGDHRASSADSRYHMSSPSQGFVAVKDVAGRAWLITWPRDSFGTLKYPAETFKDVPPEP